MRRPVLWAMLAGLWVMPAGAQTFDVPSELWLMPRSGQTVRDNAQLQRALAVYFQLVQPRVRLHYRKSDEAAAQAEELRGWLIALGIDAERIDLVEDNPAGPIKLEITESP